RTISFFEAVPTSSVGQPERLDLSSGNCPRDGGPSSRSIPIPRFGAVRNLCRRRRTRPRLVLSGQCVSNRIGLLESGASPSPSLVSPRAGGGRRVYGNRAPYIYCVPAQRPSPIPGGRAAF